MTNRQAYNKLKAIGHRFADQPYDKNLDYRSEYYGDRTAYINMAREAKIEKQLQGLSNAQLLEMLAKL